jgi:hypothetical protein
MQARPEKRKERMNCNRCNTIPHNEQGKKETVSPSASHGRVPSQVPSADLEKIFYQHYKLWNRRAA